MCEVCVALYKKMQKTKKMICIASVQLWASAIRIVLIGIAQLRHLAK